MTIVFTSDNQFVLTIVFTSDNRFVMTIVEHLTTSLR
jgi:hypothetical protein